MLLGSYIMTQSQKRKNSVMGKHEYSAGNHTAELESDLDDIYSQMWDRRFTSASDMHIFLIMPHELLPGMPSGQHRHKIYHLVKRGWVKQVSDGVLLLLHEPDEEGNFDDVWTAKFKVRARAKGKARLGRREKKLDDRYRSVWRERVVSASGHCLWLRASRNSGRQLSPKLAHESIAAMKKKLWWRRYSLSSFELLRELDDCPLDPPDVSNISVDEFDGLPDKTYAGMWVEHYVGADGRRYWLNRYESYLGLSPVTFATATGVLVDRGWLVKLLEYRGVYELLHELNET